MATKRFPLVLLTLLIVFPGLALAQAPFIRARPSLSFKAVILGEQEICG